MNITKDFHEYISVVKNTLTSKYSLKTERYGLFDKCTRLLKQIDEVGRNLETMSSSIIKLFISISVKKEFAFQ